MREIRSRALVVLFFLAIALPLVSAGLSSNAVVGGTTSNRTIQITCTAGNGYSCHSIHYSVGGAAWQHQYGADINFSVTADGNHEIKYYAIGRACDGSNCTYAVEPFNFAWAYVLGEIAPTITINSPVGGEQWGGIRQIDFNVFDAQDDELHLEIYYSSDANSFGAVLEADLNLDNYANLPDLNCYNSDWSSSTNCTYDWNTAAVADGNWFVDFNVWDPGGSNGIASIPSSVQLDNTSPFTSFVAPSGWQTSDFNVALSCEDVNGSGCHSSRYRMDLGPWEKFGVGIASTEWWDANWEYRSRIVFNNSGEAEKTDHSVLVRLTSSNFNFDAAKAAGIDIRARDANQEIDLNYFIDEFDATNQTGVVWVKVPSIDADSNTDYCYIYYGNAAASDAQASNWFS